MALQVAEQLAAGLVMPARYAHPDPVGFRAMLAATLSHPDGMAERRSGLIKRGFAVPAGCR